MVLGFKGLDFEVQYRYTVCVVNFFLIIVSMYFILKLLFLKFRPLSGSVLVVGCDSGLFVWTVNPSSPILRYVFLFFLFRFALGFFPWTLLLSLRIVHLSPTMKGIFVNY